MQSTTFLSAFISTPINSLEILLTYVKLLPAFSIQMSWNPLPIYIGSLIPRLIALLAKRLHKLY